MKLVILDRDGVINHDRPDYIKTPDEWNPIAGSLQAIARLHHHGWKIAIASNQSAIGRKIISLSALASIQNKMNRALELLGAHIDGFFFCPHLPGSGCRCRKPQPGLLQDIAHRFGASLNQVPFIGDSLKDIEAGMSVGASPILVRTGQGDKTMTRLTATVPVYKNLACAADALIRQNP